VLLGPGEAPAFEVANENGASPFVLVCDHASNRVPRRLDALGLGPGQLAGHIAWDPGAADVARGLSAELDAVLVSSGYSRLVIDCNRPLASEGSVVECSDGVAIPGNRGLSDAARRSRIESLFRPYHGAIARLLDGRGARPTLLLSIHSFTPVLSGLARPWQVGVSAGRDPRLAAGFVRALAARDEKIAIGVDEPYAIENDVDYTIPLHGDARGLPCAMIEVRQDGIATPEAAAAWAGRLAAAAREVVADGSVAERPAGAR